MTNPQLPAGEHLPEYDEDPHVDAHVLRDWLVRQLPERWGETRIRDQVSPGALEHVGLYERTVISDVVGALLSIGDAQLVKNATYRAMVKDRIDLERLGAGLARAGLSDAVVQADGDVVGAVLAVLGGGAR